MKSKYIIYVLSFLLLSGLTYRVSSPGIRDLITTDNSACTLLSIAFDEGQFAPAWYTESAIVLDRCGFTNAIQLGHYKSCMAERMNDNTLKCTDPVHLILK